MSCEMSRCPKYQILLLVTLRSVFGLDPNQPASSRRIGLAPEHVLDPAVLAHLQPSQGARRLKHGMTGEPLLHAHHHRRGAEHLPAAHAAERLVLVEGARTASGFTIEEVALTAGDAGLGTRTFAQSALHAVHFDEGEARLVAPCLERRCGTHGHARHAQRAGIAIGLDLAERRAGRQACDIGTQPCSAASMALGVSRCSRTEP